jgi:hypothetical protein
MSKSLPEQSNFIVIGAWNPAIIQPHWLRKNFSDQIPETCKIKIVSIGVASAVIMSYPKISIDPNNGRLVFIPKDLSEETMKYIAELSMGIQSKLEHTPIIAAGSNFVFQLDAGESFTLDEIEPEPQIDGLYKDMEDKGKIVSKSIRHTLSFKDYSVNITYDYAGSNRLLRINFDYQGQGANTMKRAAEGLVTNFKNSLDLKQQLIRKL